MTARIFALALAALMAGCASYRSTYTRRSDTPRELIWAYDNRFQVKLDGRQVAESGDWGGLADAVTCAPQARTWAESAASRDRTGTIMLWGGMTVMVGGAAAGSAIVFSDTDNTDQMLTGLGVVLGGLVVGLLTAPAGAYLRADAETRAIDAVNRHNDEVWSGRCAR